MSNHHNGHARDPQGRFATQDFTAIYDALDREVKRIDGALVAERSRVDGLRATDQNSLVAALTAAKTAVDAALAAAEKAVAAALIAAKEAVAKAEAAQMRTNEGQNEFRGQLKDQAATLLPRSEYAISNKAMVEKMDEMHTEIGNLRSRLDIGPPALSTLQTRSDEEAGRKKGSDATLAMIIAMATGIAIVGGAIVGIIVNLIP